jgi:hypothetical protein
MVIVKASKKSEEGVMPSPVLLAEMGKFNLRGMDVSANYSGNAPALQLNARILRVNLG